MRNVLNPYVLVTEPNDATKQAHMRMLMIIAIIVMLANTIGAIVLLSIYN